MSTSAGTSPEYREAEWGDFPEDWQIMPLGKLFTFSNGINADKTAYGSGVRFINVREPITYSHIYGPEIPGRINITKDTAGPYTVRMGDVVFNRTSETAVELGLAAVYLGSEQVVFGGFVIRGRPIDDSLDSVYLGYGLRGPLSRSQIIPLGQGAVRANIGQHSLSRVVTVVPPKAEQHAIATALSDVDGLLDALNRQIAKQRSLKQAAVQQLLTGRTRLPGFTAPWEHRNLGSLGIFLRGKGVRREEAQGGTLPCVRYGEIYTQHSDVVREFFSWISPAVAATATRMHYGDLLFTSSGEKREEIGKCVAFVENREAYAGGDIIILRAHNMNPVFMGYYCNAPHVIEQKTRRGQGDAVVHIGINALADISVALPTLSEQSAIAQVLSDMDAQIAALEARRAKTAAIKQGMMQELLTGRTRLV